MLRVYDPIMIIMDQFRIKINLNVKKDNLSRQINNMYLIKVNLFVSEYNLNMRKVNRIMKKINPFVKKNIILFEPLPGKFRMISLKGKTIEK